MPDEQVPGRPGWSVRLGHGNDGLFLVHWVFGPVAYVRGFRAGAPLEVRPVGTGHLSGTVEGRFVPSLDAAIDLLEEAVNVAEVQVLMLGMYPRGAGEPEDDDDPCDP